MRNADMPVEFIDANDPEFIRQCRPMKGLTKREYFAGLAAQGIVANQEWMENAMASSGLSGSECVAKGAVNIADALLAELDKEGQS